MAPPLRPLLFLRRGCCEELDLVAVPLTKGAQMLEALNSKPSSSEDGKPGVESPPKLRPPPALLEPVLKGLVGLPPSLPLRLLLKLSEFMEPLCVW